MKKWLRRARAVAVAVLVCLCSTQVYADSMEDAQKDKDEAEENKKSAEDILKELEATKNNLEQYVKELDAELSVIQADIEDLNKQKAELEVDIEKKQQELEQAKIDEQNQYNDMCARIQFMYENGITNYADALLTADSMCEFLNQPEYVSAVAQYDYQMLENLAATREKIANDEVMLQMDLESVEQLKAEAEERENDLNVLIQDKADSISEYEDQIARQQKLVDEYDRELQAAAERIRQLEEQASGEFVPYEGGALVWPCPSSRRITSYFGYRTPDGGYVNANHKGVDIGAPTGTPAVAAASGVVVLARYSNSAGNWVVISHGNGLYTMYMHASKLLVSEGQYVNAGDTILLVGSTGWSTGPHLHFGVGIGGYLSANAVDPMSYFQ